MDREELIALLKRFEEGKATPQEEELLEQWFHHTAAQEEWQWESEKHRASMHARLLHHVETSMGARRRFTLQPLWKVAAAAIVLCVLGLGLWQGLRQPTDPIKSVHRQYANKAVSPGNSAAILVLADGTAIALDSVNAQLEDRAADLGIRQLSKDGLVYAKRGQANGASMANNTLHIPKGGQYQLTLPDGSKVWLNANSSFTYPLDFGPDNRQVSLLGEAYFEIAEDATRPFTVKSKNITTKVLGTSFNIKAYDEEKTVTVTLSTGKVNVQKGKQTMQLAPGQSASSINEHGELEQSNVNIEEVMAWKNGYFSFTNQDIVEVMNSLSRWYNVEVRFGDGLSKRKYSGEFSRGHSMERLLHYIEQLGDVKITKEGGRLYVTK